MSLSPSIRNPNAPPVSAFVQTLESEIKNARPRNGSPAPPYLHYIHLRQRLQDAARLVHSESKREKRSQNLNNAKGRTNSTSSSNLPKSSPSQLIDDDDVDSEDEGYSLTNSDPRSDILLTICAQLSREISQVDQYSIPKFKELARRMTEEFGNEKVLEELIELERYLNVNSAALRRLIGCFDRSGKEYRAKALTAQVTQGGQEGGENNGGDVSRGRSRLGTSIQVVSEAERRAARKQERERIENYIRRTLNGAKFVHLVFPDIFPWIRKSKLVLGGEAPPRPSPRITNTGAFAIPALDAPFARLTLGKYAMRMRFVEQIHQLVILVVPKTGSSKVEGKVDGKGGDGDGRETSIFTFQWRPKVPEAGVLLLDVDGVELARFGSLVAVARRPDLLSLSDPSPKSLSAENRVHLTRLNDPGNPKEITKIVNSFLTRDIQPICRLTFQRSEYFFDALEKHSAVVDEDVRLYSNLNVGYSSSNGGVIFKKGQGMASLMAISPADSDTGSVTGGMGGIGMGGVGGIGGIAGAGTSGIGGRAGSSSSSHQILPLISFWLTSNPDTMGKVFGDVRSLDKGVVMSLHSEGIRVGVEKIKGLGESGTAAVCVLRKYFATEAALAGVRGEGKTISSSSLSTRGTSQRNIVDAIVPKTDAAPIDPPGPALIVLDPKTYLATERTFMRYLHQPALLTTTSILLLHSPHFVKTSVSNKCAYALGMAAILVTIWNFFLFQARLDLLNAGSNISHLKYASPWLGPGVLASCLMLCFGGCWWLNLVEA